MPLKRTDIYFKVGDADLDTLRQQVAVRIRGRTELDEEIAYYEAMDPDTEVFHTKTFRTSTPRRLLRSRRKRRAELTEEIESLSRFVGEKFGEGALES